MDRRKAKSHQKFDDREIIIFSDLSCTYSLFFSLWYMIQ
jgi:hypothetical protein